MSRTFAYTAALLCFTLSSCSRAPVRPSGDPALKYPGETRLDHIRPLTQGGSNADAHWSFDGENLAFQHRGPVPGKPGCDQVFTLNADGTEVRMLSNGKGRTTPALFLPQDERVVFGSTFQTNEQCPPAPDDSQGYVLPLYPDYLRYSVKTDGTDLIPFEPAEPRAYNAETTVCRDGSVIFTSDRDGDPELYFGHLDRQSTLIDVKRITNTPGYEGGAVFSPDCGKIAWHASRPRPGQELKEYKSLLKRQLVRPTELELWTADADGSHARQVTLLSGASFAPTFTPDGKRILFASNTRNPQGRKFDLYLIDTDGTHLEQVTHSDAFDSFPMFSPDGTTLAFTSSRRAPKPQETQVFLADWVEPTQALYLSSPANRFKALVEKLSAPEMEGRAPGTAGLTQAEALVEEQMRSIGLKPFFRDHQGFKQPVDVVIGKEKRRVTANNVIGQWGEGCEKKTPPIIIGAHLDHLGMGGPESLEATQAGLHPGADDNASGVAAMLEAAREIVAQPKNGSRSCFIFAAFTGEEAMIAGSARFAALFKELRIKPKAMLNLDMVGRMEKNHLIVFGSDSAREWRSILDEKCTAQHLLCDGGGDGYGPSDHMSFYVTGVPVLHFFTGPHADYHRTTDTAEKINATGGIQTAQVIAAVALQAASRTQPLHYQKASGTPSMGPLSLSGEKRGKGAYLGTIPDYATLSSPQGPGGGGETGGGVRLAGVRNGSPAEKAGVKEGDVLIAINERKVGTLQDFTHILIELTPGENVVLHIRRGKTEMALPAQIGKRS